MEITKEETISEGKYLRFKRKYFKDRNGKEKTWEYVERNGISSTFVVIFALTKNKEVILEKNYRVPFEKWFLELPMGLCDEKGEKEIKTAQRELLEETGYKAKKLIPILKGKVSSGITEIASFYFAENVELVAKPSTDPAEEIEVIKVPLNKLVNFILNPPNNTKISVLILSILPILKKKKLI
jgi:ADP-ribose pyrophosphatase